MLARPDSFRLNPFSPLAQGLVFAGLGWRGSDKTTHYHDSSLYGNSGTLTNMDPASDWSFSPDLNRWKINVASSQLIPLNRHANVSWDFTLAAWVNWQATATGYYCLLGSNVNNTSRNGIYFRCTGISGTTPTSLNIHIGHDTYSTTAWTYSNQAAQWLGWHHLAITRASSTYSLYRDGEFVSSQSQTNEFYWTTTILAALTTAGGYAWVGDLSDYLLYNRAISVYEASDLADPSNTMLSGLILPDRRKFWPAVIAAAPPSFKPAWARHCNNLIGAC